MGRPEDDRRSYVPPPRGSRGRVVRVLLSALAGGGLTAGLGGPLSSEALGSALADGPRVASDGATPITAPEISGGAQQPSGGGGGSTSTTSTPPPTTTTTTAPGSAAPSPAPTSGSSHASGSSSPEVVGQGAQKATGGQAGVQPGARTRNGQSGKDTGGAKSPASPSAGSGSTGASGPTGPTVVSGPNGVAPPPQLAAGQAAALTGQLAGSAASAQALSFYHVPLFLLPIYQAAAVEYGVPWQILAAINEIETNYGTDLSVSTAGAVGWMQFMPGTWAQYGVDALDAGYADPYNPIDAIFAAARYLRAAGAAHNLTQSIFAYNHSQEYVDSVLLRAKLISSYPTPVVAALTALVDGRPPVTGKRVLWGAPAPVSATASSATAGAVPAQGEASNGSGGPPAGQATTGQGAAGTQAGLPGSSPAPPPAKAAATAARASVKAPPLQLVELMTARNASVVAVQSGRVVGLGASRALGRYVILRDVFGDVFTYADMGSIAPTYELPSPTHAASAVAQPSAIAAGVRDPKPARAASAGRQTPVTVAAQAGQPATANPPAGGPGVTGGAVTGNAAASGQSASSEAAPAGMGKVRLFAHPGNPDARALQTAVQSRRTTHAAPKHGPLALKRGSVVAEGTVLGHVRAPLGARYGHLRFAIRLAGDPRTIDPRSILSNWSALDNSLHPQGAKAEVNLITATASDVFLLSKSQLEREVLADPGVSMSPCSRREVLNGAIDKRALAVISFLSRSGLKPTVGTLECAGGAFAEAGFVSSGHAGDAVAITRINGVPIAGHQGSGSIADTTIRTLLTLQGEFVPAKIVSLMRYPGAPSTLARSDHGDYIEIVYAPAPRPQGRALATAARSAPSGPAAPAPTLDRGELSPTQWEQLIARVATLPVPAIATKPSSAAIADPKKP